jgi:hypothetical protein
MSEANEQSASIRTQLYRAIEANDSAGVELALLAGADPTGADGYTPRPLVHAVRNASIAICYLLIEGGALKGAAGAAGTSPLHEAARTNALDHCRLLVEKGFDINERDDAGKTALHVAVLNGNGLISRYLIESGASVHLVDNSNMTALHYAARHPQPADGLWLAEILIAGGASPSAASSTPTPEYLTPFQQAVKKGRRTMVQYFVDECGEDPAQFSAAGVSMPDLAKGAALAEFLRARITAGQISNAISDYAADESAVGQPHQSRCPSFGIL